MRLPWHSGIPPFRRNDVARSFVRSPGCEGATPAMVAPTVITAKRLWDKSRLVDDPVVVIEEGYVVSVGTRGEAELPDWQVWILREPRWRRLFWTCIRMARRGTT